MRDGWVDDVVRVVWRSRCLDTDVWMRGVLLRPMRCF